jgi:hypothetical protein
MIDINDFTLSMMVRPSLYAGAINEMPGANGEDSMYL